ncbi:MAG: hypothetical protein V7776_11125 [Halopseudomonas aestusnigri]
MNRKFLYIKLSLLSLVGLYTKPVTAEEFFLKTLIDKQLASNHQVVSFSQDYKAICTEWRGASEPDKILQVLTPDAKKMSIKINQDPNKLLSKIMTATQVAGSGGITGFYRVRKSNDRLDTSNCRMSVDEVKLKYIKENLFDLTEMGSSTPPSFPAKFEQVTLEVPFREAYAELPEEVHEIFWRIDPSRQYLYLSQ